MQVRQLKVTNFRGIASLDWKPTGPFCCLIGPGDAGKSTILDAVEATLSSRWFSFAEYDFVRCDTSTSIVIEVTIGELSKALKSDDRYGLYIRGWTPGNELHAEPEGTDEPVLTVRLTVNATMEPVWELVCDRAGEPRTLSNRDRALFGLVRLAGDDARQLSWGQGSVLSRLTGETDEAAARLAEAYRSARASAKLHEIGALKNAAESAERFAKELGAYVEGSYGPGLELGRTGFSSGSIALHDDSVPLRLAGLGSRRLATLAIQKSAISEGAIVLVDEIEHGLEPHRIVGAISQLKSDQATAVSQARPVGQVLMTTHSDTALGEAGPETLRVVNTTRPGRAVEIARPQSIEAMRSLLRFTPKALFARRILVCEGYTEVGLLMGLRSFWPARHDGKPIEYMGSAITDGNGAQACAMAISLSNLGFSTAIYRDSDEELSAEQMADLALSGVQVFEYGRGLCTEQAIFTAASDDQVQRLLDYAREERGLDFINHNLVAAISELDASTIQADFGLWQLLVSLNGQQLRDGIWRVASGKAFPGKKENKKNWFKDQRLGRGLAPIVRDVVESAPATPLAATLAKVETWLYA